MADSEVEIEQEVQEVPSKAVGGNKGRGGRSTVAQSGVKIAGYGLVKAVLSGDTVVVLGGATPETPVAPKKELVISGILAPKFARGKAQDDEPFAWEAREFLRKKVIGQQISFSVNFAAEDREFAVIHLDAENLAHSLVRAGLAKVKPQGPNASSSRIPPEREALLDLQRLAESEGLGIWKKGGEKAHIRNVDWAPTASFLQSIRGKKIPGVVEKVLSGSIIRIETWDPSAPNKHKLVTLHLAGVQSPRTALPAGVVQQQDGRRPAARLEENAAFATEAQEFTEARLLHRDVQIFVQGVDKTETALGSVIHPKGNISLKLLEAGLARKVAWSLPLTHDEDAYNNAEKVGKAKHANLFAVEEAEPPKREFHAKVMFVPSGDSLVLKVGEEEEKRYSLASIRAPRMGIPRRGEPDQPFAWEAREFVRTRLIGKKVRVVVEYTQTFPNSNESRDCVSVYAGPQEIGEALVGAGLGEVLRHSLDGPRSSNYGKLLEQETLAEKSGRGKFGPKSMEPKIMDLTERFNLDGAVPAAAAPDAEEPSRGPKSKPKKDDKPAPAKSTSGTMSRARRFLSVLQREKQLPAVVEYVFSGTRLKLWVPKENVMLFFAMSAVRSPAAKRKDGSDEPLSAAALDFVRSKILQQTVTIDVERLDKNENFLGQIYWNRQNLGAKLLAEGLGSISFSSERDPPELAQAEAQAKAAKKGMWENFVEPEVKAEKEEEGEGVEQQTLSKVQNIFITEILDASSFYFRSASDPNFAMIGERMEAFGEETPDAPEDFAPKKGDVVAGLFLADGKWYRARVDSATRNGDFKVFFIDYGNHEVLAVSDMRPLPEEMVKLPGVSRAGVLAGLRPPSSSSEHFDAAAIAFNDLAFDRELVATLENRGRDGKAHMTLTAPDAETSINVQLLQAGWCRLVDRAGPLQAYVQALKPEEDAAKEARLHIWEYGDVSDEEEEAPQPQQPRRARDDGRPPKRQ